MNRIYLVACSKAKLDVPAQARHLYDSPWFRLARDYVEQEIAATGGRWFILSALHCLVHPLQIIEPYQRRMSDWLPVQRREWGFRVARQLEAYIALGDEVVILAGREYRAALGRNLGRRVDVTVPLEGLGIGQQLRWLKQATTPGEVVS